MASSKSHSARTRKLQSDRARKSASTHVFSVGVPTRTKAIQSRTRATGLPSPSKGSPAVRSQPERQPKILPFVECASGYQSGVFERAKYKIHPRTPEQTAPAKNGLNQTFDNLPKTKSTSPAKEGRKRTDAKSHAGSENGSKNLLTVKMPTARIASGRTMVDSCHP